MANEDKKKPGLKLLTRRGSIQVRLDKPGVYVEDHKKPKRKYRVRGE